MTMPSWTSGVKTINLRDLVNEINAYRRDLGIPFKTFSSTDTLQSLQQELTSLRYQWQKSGSMWTRNQLFKPAPITEATPETPETPSPETPGTQPGKTPGTRIRNMGGWEVLEEWDNERGDFIVTQVLGRSKESEQMSERERQFLALEQQQLGRLRQNQGANIAKKQAEEFELWRNRMLSQLSGPANEVAKWFVQHKANPYEQMMWSPAGGYEALGQAYATAQERTEAMNQPGGAMTPGEYQAQAATLSSALARTVEEEEAVREFEREKNLALSAYQRGPETPSWVKEFAPEVGATLALGYGLGSNVPPPSGQQLTKMTPGQSEWLGGTMDFFGKQRWEDLMAKAAVMQPRTPRGAGGSRWSPARSV